MLSATCRNIAGAIVIAFVSSTIARAQSKLESPIPEPAPQIESIPLGNGTNALRHWDQAIQVSKNERRLFVVTAGQPERKQVCRVKSFTIDKLVCSHGMKSRTYLSKQVVALIVPGEGRYTRILMVLTLNGLSGATAWGAYVLAAGCPACAVGMGVLALCIFAANGAILMGDPVEERLLYLAPGQKLTGRLRDIHPLA